MSNFKLGEKVIWNDPDGGSMSTVILQFSDDRTSARISIGGLIAPFVPVSELEPYVSCEDRLRAAEERIAALETVDPARVWTAVEAFVAAYTEDYDHQFGMMVPDYRTAMTAAISAYLRSGQSDQSPPS